MQTEVNAAILDYATHIAENNPELVSDSEKAGFTYLKGGGKYGSSKIWGPLTGKYVANHMYEDFTTYRFHNEIIDGVYDVLKVYDKTKARQFFKKLHTVFNPGVQLGNYLSNFTFAWLNGIDPLTFGANRVRARKIYNQKGKEYKELVESGILGSDVLTSDFIPMSSKMSDATKVVDEERAGWLKRRKEAIKKGAIKADEFATDTYVNNDNIAKLAAYLSLKDQGMDNTKAMETVYRGFQNYATVGKMWDVFSKLPVFGKTYVKFQADLMRILKNAITRRPLTTAGYLMALKALTLAASKYWSDEDDIERKIREGRSFIPKIPNPLGGEDIALVMQTPYGEFNIARYASPFYMYDMGDMENASEFLWKFAPVEVVEVPSYEKGTSSYSLKTGDVFLGPYYEAFIADKDFRKKSIQDPKATRWTATGATPEEKTWNALNYIARSQVPLFKLSQDTYMSATTGKDFYGRNKSVMDNFISQFIKVEQIKEGDYKVIAKKELTRLYYTLKENDEILRDVYRSNQKELDRATKDYRERNITNAQLQRTKKKIQDQVKRREAPLLEEKAEIHEKLNKWVDLYKELTGKDPF
jgi:hypothetical protein